MTQRQAGIVRRIVIAIIAQALVIRWCLSGRPFDGTVDTFFWLLLGMLSVYEMIRLSKPKRSHPIRLAVYMLAGAAISLVVFAPVLGNGQDPWDQARPLTWGLGGALVGLAFELIRRFLEWIETRG
jgi:hypothetical protein